MLNPNDILKDKNTFESALIQHFSKEGKAELSKGELNRLMRSPYRERQYHTFQIPKKSGGFRAITAPTGKLKYVQSFIADALSGIVHFDTSVNGFVKSRSVVTNARMHLGKNYILNIDLKDFFPSITAEMVQRALAVNGFKSVSKTITELCTWAEDVDDDLPEQVLPQGAPTSPILSNLVCWHLDYRLQMLAGRCGLTYSRYADDITFSSDHSVYSKDSHFWTELRRIISECGFAINEEKTRLLKQGCRKEVTGITVGDKLNVPRKWLKNLRAAIFQMEMFGCSEQERRRIRGKLSYLKMIRGDDDLYTRLFYRYCDALCSPPFLELHKLPDYYSRPLLRASSLIAVFDESEYDEDEPDNPYNPF